MTVTNIESISPATFSQKDTNKLVEKITINGTTDSPGLLELRGYSPLLIGSDITNTSNFKTPLLKVKGRSDIIGGISISTNINDCVIGRPDKNNSDEQTDQTGSMLIKSKGYYDSNNIQTKLGLEVYHGCKLTSVTDETNQISYTSNKMYSFSVLNQLGNQHELTYNKIKDSSHVTGYSTMFKNISNDIYLHSDNKTIITNGIKSSIDISNSKLNITTPQVSITSDVRITGNLVIDGSGNTGSSINISGYSLFGIDNKNYIDIKQLNNKELIKIYTTDNIDIETKDITITGDQKISLKSTMNSLLTIDNTTMNLKTDTFNIDCSGLININTPQMDIFGSVQVNKELIIGLRNSTHFRITTLENGSNMSLIINKYNKDSLIANICEFDM